MNIDLELKATVREVDDQRKVDQVIDPNTSAKELRSLIKDTSPVIRFLAAYHSNADNKCFEIILQDDLSWVREAAAFNTNLPTTELDKLIANGDQSMCSALACNPSLSEKQQLSLLAKLQADAQLLRLANTTTYSNVWQNIGERCNGRTFRDDYGESIKHWGVELKRVSAAKAKPSNLNGLLRRCDYRFLWVTRILARMKGCPKNLLSLLMYYCPKELIDNSDVALQLLADPGAIKEQPYKEWKVDKWLSEGDAPGMVANYFLMSVDLKRQRQAARAKFSTPYKWQTIALHPDSRVRSRIAARPDITPFMVYLLADDEKPGVRDAVTENKKIAKGHIRGKTIKKTSAKAGQLTPRQRVAIAEDARHQKDHLRIAKDPLAKVRIALATNSSVDEEVLLLLCDDRSKAVRKEVATLRGRRSAIFAKLLQDKLPEVRVLLIQYSNGVTRFDVTLSQVIQLADDQDEEVRQAVVNQYKRAKDQNRSCQQRGIPLEYNPNELMQLEKKLQQE